MPSEPRHFRIFLSSPGDVAAERAEAIKLTDQLPYEPAFRDKLTIHTVAWDKEGADTPLLATMTPQEAINQGLPKPSECDIVIVVFWSRMGTPLPPEYIKADGSRYLSGTEWEYWDAFNAAKANGKPLLLMYRRTEEPVIGLRDPKRNDKIEQYERVEQFFAQFVGPMGELLSGYNAYETPDQFRAKLETHLKILLLRLLEAPSTGIHSETERHVEPAALWPGSPFPGLRAFRPEDAPIFFGRGRETDDLVKRVSESRFVAVVGASGSGKSSLVGAGLIPRLISNAIDGSKDWTWLRFTPGGLGDNPFMALAAELKNLTERHGWNARQIAEKLAIDPTALDEIAVAALADQPAWAELLLFIDQFEELFTLVKADYTAPFAAFLNAAAISTRVRVVVTMRSDFYHRCVDVLGLVGLLQNGSYPLGVPDHFALLEMIERPSERAGLSFETDLPKRIVRDTGGEPGGLALMAYTLDELYERSMGERRLTHADYEALGGVQGAIGTRAENTFAQLSANAQASFASVFRDLVEVDERGTATRQRAPLSRFTEGSTAFVSAFVDARLFMTSEDQQRVPLVEVAHEALLRKWKRLVDWIETTQDDLRLLRQLRTAAHEWDISGRKRGYLWIEERGEALRIMLERLSPHLNKTERLFARREAEHLIDEINDISTTDQRRLAIGERLSVIKDPRNGVGLDTNGLPKFEWLPVIGGKITLRNEEGALLGEFNVRPFYIAKYPVTYVQFQVFIDAADGFENDQWWSELDPSLRNLEKSEQRQRFSNYPRDNTLWAHAVAYTKWVNFKYRKNRIIPQVGDYHGNHTNVRQEDFWEIRLPHESEWQYAATGNQISFRYPWGEKWQVACANTREAGLARTTAVGMYPQGDSPVGASDMAGNVWEWCLNEYKSPKSVGLNSVATRALRGGAYYLDGKATAMNWARIYSSPSNKSVNYGFRVVYAPPIG